MNMSASPDARIENLTRFLFTAPPWYIPACLIVLAGMALDLAMGWVPGFLSPGTLAFTLPALLALVTTKPLAGLAGAFTTWNRSASLALACLLFSAATTLPGILLPYPGLFSFLYAFSLGLVFGVRLLVLVAIADYRPARMLPAALSQSIWGLPAGRLLFPGPFLPAALVAHLAIGGAALLLIYLIERPLLRIFRIHIFHFLNAFLAHLTDGSRGMEGFFSAFGEKITLPQVSFLFRRQGKGDILLTVPNVHPGPVGDEGGGRLPHILHDSLGGEVLVAHGCSTHDYNLTRESEAWKVVSAVRESLAGITPAPAAGRSARVQEGSVNLLAQRFADSLLLVGTRAPERTEDLDPAIGWVLWAEGHRLYGQVAFVDAHNSMTEVSGGTYLGSPIAEEYLAGALRAMEEGKAQELLPFRAGAARVAVPFTREEGIGDLGVQALLVEVAGQRTGYVLVDGNNIWRGGREVLLGAVRGLVDDAEVMTTDSHVVNTITGKNPVGLRVPPEEIAPYVRLAVEAAIADLAPAEAGASTAWCRDIEIFGPQRISQISSVTSAIMNFIGPLGVSLLLCSYLLTLVTYMALL
jgi:putative membrane protein